MVPLPPKRIIPAPFQTPVNMGIMSGGIKCEHTYTPHIHDDRHHTRLIYAIRYQPPKRILSPPFYASDITGKVHCVHILELTTATSAYTQKRTIYKALSRIHIYILIGLDIRAIFGTNPAYIHYYQHTPFAYPHIQPRSPIASYTYTRLPRLSAKNRRAGGE